jgi:hypothetical protein
MLYAILSCDKCRFLFTSPMFSLNSFSWPPSSVIPRTQSCGRAAYHFDINTYRSHKTIPLKYGAHVSQERQPRSWLITIVL